MARELRRLAFTDPADLEVVVELYEQAARASSIHAAHTCCGTMDELITSHIPHMRCVRAQGFARAFETYLIFRTSGIVAAGGCPRRSFIRGKRRECDYMGWGPQVQSSIQTLPRPCPTTLTHHLQLSGLL